MKARFMGRPAECPFGLAHLVQTPAGLMRCVFIDKENRTAGFVGEIAYRQERYKPTHTFKWSECGGRS